MGDKSNLIEVCGIIKTECDVVIHAENDEDMYQAIDGILELIPLLLKASDMTMNTDGGPGSGNWGHGGRPGKKGGSAGGTGGAKNRTGTKETGFTSMKVKNQDKPFGFTGGKQNNIKLIDGSPATEDEILTALQHQYGVPKSRAKKMVEEGELSNNQVQRAMNAESAREMMPAGRMRTERTNELNKKFGVSEEVQTKKASDREANIRKEREREAELDKVQGPIRKEKKKLIEQQGNKAKSISDSKLANKEYETKTTSGTEKTSLQKALNAKNVEQTKQVLDQMPEGTKFVCTGQSDRAHTLEKLSKPSDSESKWRKKTWKQNAAKTDVSESWENIDTAYAEQLIRFSGNNGVHIVE